MAQLEEVRKALDTTVGANFARQDLSDLLTLVKMPKRPVVNALAHKRASNTTHQWNEPSLNDPTGSTASYNQGNKPYNKTLAPTQRYNTTARFGRTAQVTDEMAAVWRGAGAYRLDQGDIQRLMVEALSLNIEEQMEELLNEVEFVAVRGAASNNSTVVGSEVSQFDGIDLMVNTGSNGGGPGQRVNASSAALSESMLRTLAFNIRQQKAPIFPDTFLVLPHEQQIVNQWHPSQYVVGVYQNMVGGFEVTQYETGFGVVNILSSDWLPSSPTGSAYLLNLQDNLFFADLIPIGTEPLARVATTVETMLTWTVTLETRAIATSTGAIYGLSES